MIKARRSRVTEQQRGRGVSLRDIVVTVNLVFLVTVVPGVVAAEGQQLRRTPLNATVLDCALRHLALRYAHKIQPWRRASNKDSALEQDLRDALQLEVLCPNNVTRASTKREDTASLSSATAATADGHHFRRYHDDDSAIVTAMNSFVCPSKHCLFVRASTHRHQQQEQTNHRQYSTQQRQNASFPSFLSLHDALDFSRRHLGEPRHTTLVLLPGLHTLESPLHLGQVDAGLVIMGLPQHDHLHPSSWISGAIAIPPATHWDYDCSLNLHVRVANLTQLLSNRTIPRLPSLFSTKKRWNRARYPNGDFETTQWGYQSPGRFQHAIPPDQVVEWHRPPPGTIPEFVYHDNLTPSKNDSAMPLYNVYATGRGGVCADLWDNHGDSYWCSNASAGGWAEVDRECAVTGQLQIPVGLSYRVASPLGQRLARWPMAVRGAGGGIVHAWHSQTWAMHMFSIERQQILPENATGNHSGALGVLRFAPGGGNQGGRNWCRCDQCTYAGPWCGQHQSPPNHSDQRLVSGFWLIENVLAELDEPGEYYFDRSSQLLYVYPNRTMHDPMGGLQDLRLALLEELITIRGTANITLRNIGVRDTASTYMGKWGVPSGGDWALHRGGALFLRNVTNISIEECTFERLDGNAIFLSGRTRNVTIRRNSFAWIGENAIATWGDTDGFDGLARNFPIGTLIEGNVMRELGIYQKQSSAYAHNKAALTTLRYNIMFNVPRAAINFNDMLGGGDLVYRNLIFNTCRESGDHGAINTWDRQPFLSDIKDGTPSFTQGIRKIWSNLIFANYGAGWGLDNDDGSSWYHVHKNVFYASQGFKMDYGGHDSRFSENVVITFPTKWRQMCIDFARFLPGHGHEVVQNTCIVPGADNPIIQLSSCQNSQVISMDNEYYTPSGNATVLCGYASEPVPFHYLEQYYGLENRSTVQRNPEKIYPILRLVLQTLCLRHNAPVNEPSSNNT